MKTLTNFPLRRAVALILVIQISLFFNAFGRERKMGTGHFNACWVEADFTPAKDSIITKANSVIPFENASLNATSYRFIINGIPYPQNTRVNISISVGIHTVQLIAYNGECTDTITRHYFCAGVQPSDFNDTRAFYGYGRGNQYVSDFKPMPGGGFVIAGYFANNSFFNFPNQSFITRVNDAGQIEWSRIIKPNPYYDGRITAIAPTKDGGMLVTGVYALSSNTSYLMKLDQNGNLIWKRVTSNEGIGFGISSLIETEDGGVIISAVIMDRPELAIARFDAAGNNLWTKLFAPMIAAYNRYITILHKDNAVFVSGQISYDQEEVIADGATVFKLDYNSGSLRWWKNYRSPTGYFQCRDMRWNGDRLLIDGNTPSVHGGKIVNAFFTIDTDGNASNGFQTYAVGTSNNEFSQMHPSKDGGFYIVSSGTVSPTVVIPGLQTGISYHTIAIRLKPDFSVDWSYQMNGLQFPFSAVAADNTFALVGEKLGYGIHANYDSWRPMLKKMNKAGHPICEMGGDSAYTKPIDMTATSFDWIQTQNASFILTDTTMGFYESYFVKRYVCPTEFVDSCDFAVLDGPKIYCNTTTSYTYKIKKLKNCEQQVDWKVSAPATIVSQSNDELKIRFNSLGKYVITAVIKGGSGPIIDSIIASTGTLPTPPLSLGNDTTICDNTSITLRASRHYLNYEWQDGSTSQKYIVNKPGVYWVKVTDLCGNELRDTIVITPRAGIEINAGPDLEKCNADTIQLVAPPGYLSYSWSPDYRISSKNTAIATVSPPIDTAYVIKAEKIPGCYAYDTIRIKVNASPVIYLGADTSFCSGEYLTLDAGKGFQNYRWNTGESTQQISAGTAGLYSVVATTKEGCTSKDTIEIINVWEKPQVRISGARPLCSNESIVLNAGNFASYLWQDGSNTPEISVSNEGIYYVTVWDNNQCAGSDTVLISDVLPAPANFLPADTIICNGESLNLQVPGNFRSYLWSDGSVISSKTIKSEANYWLQVTDNNNCVGKDSIFVKVEDCIKGFNIPTAFSPNGDGRNDLFRPIIVGNLVKYQFNIFDRNGVIVFTTPEPGKGWDGKVNGNISAGSVFVWTCTYQMEGEAIKTEKGSVFIML